MGGGYCAPCHLVPGAGVCQALGAVGGEEGAGGGGGEGGEQVESCEPGGKQKEQGGQEGNNTYHLGIKSCGHQTFLEEEESDLVDPGNLCDTEHGGGEAGRDGGSPHYQPGHQQPPAEWRKKQEKRYQKVKENN